MPRKRILIVEDEDGIAELECLILRRADLDYARASSAEEALELMGKNSFDLVLLDLMLPGMGGMEFAKILKGKPKTAGVPIVMITAKTEESDIVEGLDGGASDYITKPFSPKVLIAKINARLREGSSAQSSLPEKLSDSGIVLDFESRKAFLDGSEISLTQTEFAILGMLVAEKGKPLARDVIVSRLYRTGYAVNGRAIDVQIVNLRRKLGEKSSFIKTVRGMGYEFNPQK